jgi:hypothetical protein
VSVIATRWSHATTVPLETGDITDGQVSDGALRRACAVVVARLVADVPALSEDGLKQIEKDVRRGLASVDPTGLRVLAGVTEVYLSRFTVQARALSMKDGQVAGTALVDVIPPNGVSDEMRAQLIAPTQRADITF